MGDKIRDDLEGVVYVDGKPLKAGDDIPEGVEVGDHLLPEKVAPQSKEPANPAGEKTSK